MNSKLAISTDTLCLLEDRDPDTTTDANSKAPKGGGGMWRGTEANYCALALIIAAKEELKPEEACAKMVVPMSGKRILTDADHSLIQELLKKGETYREIAGRFGRTERAMQKTVSKRAKRERMEQSARAESCITLGTVGNTCGNWGKGERDQVMAN
jgi:hypothetical protein